MKITYNEVFDFGILIKGIHGLLEIITGLALFFISSSFITSFLTRIFRHELLQDPNDIAVNFLLHHFSDISANVKIFFTLYLIIYGLINLLIAISILSKKDYFHLIGMALFSFTLIYQVTRVFSAHSLTLAIITFIDLFIFVIVLKKYYSKK